MSTFSDAVAEKYNIMHQEANARTNLENTQASVIPGQAKSDIALKGAQTFQTQQQGEQVAPLAGSQIDETAARSRLYGAQAGLTGTQNQVEGLGLRPAGDAFGRALGSAFRASGAFAPSTSDTGFHTGTADVVSDDHARAIHRAHPKVQAMQQPQGGMMPQGMPQHMKKGASNVKGTGKGGGLRAALGALQGAGGAGLQAPMPGSPMASPMMGGNAPQVAPSPLGMFAGGTVPGQGSGKVDTVPAVLAPHEAVLNRAAADQIGRKKIAAANAKGAQKMGTAPKPGNLPTKRPPLRRGMV